VFDETPRIDEATILAHWSVKSLDATAAGLGPFAPGEVHRLYIEASDDIGLVSLGIVRSKCSRPAPGTCARSSWQSSAPRRGRPIVFAARGWNVEVAVYDVAGRRVATLESSTQPAGKHTLTWDATGFGQGMYYYRLRVGTSVMTKPLLILR
jgi:hypothetical protein